MKRIILTIGWLAHYASHRWVRCPLGIHQWQSSPRVPAECEWCGAPRNANNMLTVSGGRKETDE